MTEEELFAAWHREFEIQNRELKDEGEEPLTPAEFFACRAEDAIVNRMEAEKLRVDRWHATYNAAIASCTQPGPYTARRVVRDGDRRQNTRAAWRRLMMPAIYILGTAAIAVITYFIGWYSGYETGRWMELERQRRDGRQ